MKNQWTFSVAALLCASLVIFSFTRKYNGASGVAKISTIIIDAGHGFKGSLTARDGAFGTEATEDEISYEVSKKVVAELQKIMPEVKVLESRPTPYFVTLKQRSDFANSNKGNLFVSIHCNYAPQRREVQRVGSRTETYYTKGKGKSVKKTRVVPVYKTYYYPNPAHGTETYVFAAHKTDDKEDIILENGDIFQNEKDDETINVNINDPVVKQQVALWTKQFFANSVKLATIVEEEFVTIGRNSRGVKQRQKGIWVLQATAMPSILIELGFLSHRPEEEFLMSHTGQQTMAESIARAINRYKELVERGPSVQQTPNGR
ncbi:MAG TPA: N-acetylmuramoyl-L-alanine amidase [Lacibacter sp.]|nr:N-acetylmuramoyl-L-alanine amidase [Lacibacter sp.]